MTLCSLFLSQSRNHALTFPDIPAASTFTISLSWHTLSKAFGKSRYTTSIESPLSAHSVILSRNSSKFVWECGGVELMMKREGVVDGEEEHTAIMSGHHSFLEEIQRRLEQVMQVEALINEEEDCSWSGCEVEQLQHKQQV
jgi:hypothetical protein